MENVIKYVNAKKNNNVVFNLNEIKNISVKYNYNYTLDEKFMNNINNKINYKQQHIIYNNKTKCDEILMDLLLKK